MLGQETVPLSSSSICHMITIPLLTLLPARGREPSSMDIALARHRNQPIPRARVFKSTRKIMASLVAGDDYGNDARNSIERVLECSSTYAEWIRSMPDLMVVAALKGYREDRSYMDRPDSVVEAIRSNGALLPPGQILFRGGQFDGSTTFLPEVPISTSLLPQVAHSHCGKSGFQFARFVTAPGSQIVCVVFSASDKTKFSHESEVLIAGAIKMRHIWSRKVHTVTLHEFEISHA